MPVYRLTEKVEFPPPHLAEEGLLAVGGDLSHERLLLAYAMGIFPWYSDGEPILWWSPDPRLILPLNRFRPSRRLRRTLRQGAFTVTMDTAFDRVIEACATVPRQGQDGTWITPEMVEAYRGLHEAGYAHAAECWRDGELVGGIYGLSLGACFFGESMFSRVSNASKVALATLVAQLKAWGFSMIDCQVTTPHMLSFGAGEVRREHFLRMLAADLRTPTRVGTWRLELDTTSTT